MSGTHRLVYPHLEGGRLTLTLDDPENRNALGVQQPGLATVTLPLG